MYNEQQGIDAFFNRLQPILSGITAEWEIICINDGSQDETLELLKKHSNRESRIKIINFSRNFGKEAALTAGIDYCSGKAVIPIDADLQDPPEIIPEMVEKWKQEFKVVLATRKKREGETFLKKFTASSFYKIISKISDIDIPQNTGDFRLMDRQVIEAIKQLPERNRFMKGILSWPGFSTTTIYFDREARYAGTSAWGLWKLWQFALDGIFAFTSAPLKIWTYLGVIISLISFIYASFLVVRTMIHGVDLPGYASLMVVMLFLGGIQLISLGVIGEYISRIYNESKGRPIYIVGETFGFKK
jgi:glycosyltransferase involved in cell wall biosynthesis